VRPIVRWHHERLDGTGYPDGLRGEQIPLIAQMTGIVDVFDALTTDRVYRNRLTWDDACNVLQQEAAYGWRSAHLVEEFISLCRTGGLQPLATR
jgi:putative two-component system response regulator